MVVYPVRRTSAEGRVVNSSGNISSLTGRKSFSFKEEILGKKKLKTSISNLPDYIHMQNAR